MHPTSLPRISIVTPSFNQRDFLEETLRSVIEQQYPDLEYIVVDGGSTDGSVDVIKRYASHFLYWDSTPDNGHGDALNRGFRHATGEVMGWINSDDKYFPWTLHTVAQIFRLFPEVEWIVGVHAWWDDKGRLIRTQTAHKNVYDFIRGRFEWIQQESVFWRRSLWERAGGAIDERFRFMVDGELWSRFFLHARLYTVECVLSGYRLHGANRANTHREACLAEMRSAVETLKAKCPSTVLARSRSLENVARVIKHMPWGFRAESAMRHALPNLYRDAAYDVIRYEGDDRWKLDQVAYSVL